MPKFVKVATTREFEGASSGKLVEVNGQDIALFKADGNYYAIENTCPHAGGPLAEGELEGEVVTCPWHGSQFNVKTGAVVAPPANRGVRSFPVRVTGNDVEIEVE
jgi:nitrite reductase/ring-hydroxylating ferredoxin subunit